MISHQPHAIVMPTCELVHVNLNSQILDACITFRTSSHGCANMETLCTGEIGTESLHIAMQCVNIHSHQHIRQPHALILPIRSGVGVNFTHRCERLVSCPNDSGSVLSLLPFSTLRATPYQSYQHHSVTPATTGHTHFITNI